MKIFAILFAVLVVCGSHTLSADQANPQKDPGEPIAVGWTFSRILGTTLETSDFYSSQMKSGWKQHRCTIGYRRTGDDGGFRIAPVIVLPDLENDTYVVTFEAGKIRVSTKIAATLVLELHLDAIAPSTITLSAEQDGADQPATAPESKPEDNEEHKSESEARSQ